MNNLGVTIVVMEFKGKPDSPNIFSEMAFVSAALNMLILCYSLSQILERSGQGRCYATLFIASLIGAICNIVFYAAENEEAMGFIIMNTVYRAFIRLSCVTMFPISIDKLKKSGSKANIFKVGNYFTGLAWLKAFVAVGISIGVKIRCHDALMDSFYAF